jgi:protein-tyrosine-phosphatase
MRSVTQDRVPIFMLHRMEDRERGVRGFSPDKLRQFLQVLRQRDVRFVSLEEVYNRLHGKSDVPLNNVAAFTMDDGFADQIDIALPIFLEYECPVTVFLITGFLDDKLWPWPDHVAYIFENTERTELSVTIDGEALSYDLSNIQNQTLARRDFQSRCKNIPHDDIPSVIRELSEKANVFPPAKPPISNSAVEWSKVRELEDSHTRFGPHTVSHGIVSQMSAENAAREIVESWGRLTEELAKPCKVFAWPNGRMVDYGLREMQLLQKNDFIGAVCTESELADVRPNYRHPYAAFQLGRLGMPETLFDLLQTTTWIYHLKWLVRPKLLRTRYASLSGFAKYSIFSALSLTGIFSFMAKIDWLRVRRVIFVCTGNICRSPYAEGRAAELGLQAISAGLAARTRGAAHPTAVKNAEYRGINLFGHEAQKVDDLKITENDLIFCMTPSHFVSLKVNPRLKDAQISLLGLFATSKTAYIPDPYLASSAYFQRCFQMIDEAVQNVANKITAA